MTTNSYELDTKGTSAVFMQVHASTTKNYILLKKSLWKNSEMCPFHSQATVLNSHTAIHLKKDSHTEVRKHSYRVKLNPTTTY
jgi:hypothetical protein